MKSKIDTETLTIQNQYIFAEVMRNERICRGFLQRALPEIPIGRLEYIESEKTHNVAADAHGIRVDIYAEDNQRVYDVEMQVQNEGDLSRRSRYSASLLDEMSLERGGRSYNILRDSIVIFICVFDPFGKGRKKYTFQNTCAEEPDLLLGDGATKIFLNATGTNGEITPELQSFLNYVVGKPPADDFVREIDGAVGQARKDRRVRAMISKAEMDFNTRMENATRRGLEEGMQKGLQQGMAIVDKERKRADAAELEVQRLKAELEELKKRLADS